MEIHVRTRQGESQRSVAQSLGISRNTVKKYLTNGQPVYKDIPKRQTKLVPFHHYLYQRIEAAQRK